MLFSALLRLLSALFRKFAQICHPPNVADYLKRLWSLILMLMQRLHRLCSASSHEPGPSPIYKSSAASANPIVASRGDETTTNAAMASGEICQSHWHVRDLLRLEEGQQNHLEIASSTNTHPSYDELTQSIHDTSEEQSQSRSPKLLEPIFPWNAEGYPPMCERFSLVSLFLSLFEPTAETLFLRLS